LAGRRAIASEMVAPDGLDQSSGTFKVPHWVCGDFSHADQAILKGV
jgi:ribosomal protein L32